MCVPGFGLARDGSPVRLAGGIYLGDLPTVVAEQEGLFAGQGLDVAVEYSPSGKRNLERLRAGETDFALMALTPLVLDRLADATPGGPDDPVILASLVHSTRFNQVAVLADGGIDSAADLRGRRVGLRKGTNAEFVWWVFSQYHGLEPDAAEVRDLPVARLPDALAAGEIDAAVIWEPWTSRLRERLGGLKTLPGANLYTAKWVLVTSRRTARNAPALCAAVISTYGEAIDRIERDPDHAIRTYAARTGVEPEVLRGSWRSLDYDLSLEWSLVAALQQQLAWAGGAGDVTRRIDVLSMIAPGPLGAAFPAAVGLPRPAGHGGDRP